MIAKDRVGFFNNSFLYTGFFFSLAAVLVKLPFFAQFAVAILIAWRFAIDRFQLAQPKRWLINVAAILLVVIVRLYYGLLVSEDPITAILVVLTALKILELREESDMAFLILLGLAIIGVNFVFYFEIYIVIPGFVSFFLLMCGLLGWDEKPWRRNWQYRVTLQTTLLSLPFAAILFIFFPRQATSFSFNTGAGSASSGLSDVVNPGSVTELALSNELVMRVEVAKELLRPDELYWATLILDQSDGLNWSLLKTHADRGSPSGSEFNYRITLEPNQSTQVPTQRRTTRVLSESMEVYQRPDGLFRTREGVIRERLSYTGTVSSGKKYLPLDIAPFLSSTAVSNKFQVLVNRLSGRNLTTQEKVKNLKLFFAENSFHYTLTPGTDSKTLDEFLFKGKKGFCEHFAASGGVLLRNMGVPTRLVIGYQGGVWNEYGGFWKVTQKDAHAWIEYVNDNGFWETLDLVNEVSPLRIELGADIFFSLPADLAGAKDINALRKSLVSRLEIYWDKVTLFAESLNFMWTQFLLDFDLNKQREIFLSLKFPKSVLFIVAILFATLFSLVFFRLSNSRGKLTESQKIYLRLISWSQKNGISKNPWDSPLIFRKKIVDKYPNCEIRTDQIVNFYLADRFGKSTTELDQSHRHKFGLSEAKKAIRSLEAGPI